MKTKINKDDVINFLLGCIVMPMIFLCGDGKGYHRWWHTYTQWIVIAPGFIIISPFLAVFWLGGKLFPYKPKPEPTMKQMLTKMYELDNENK